MGVMNMKIAISQFDMPFEDIETNKKEVKDIIMVAKLNHADLIVFPEMTLTGFTMKCKEMYDESIDDFFKELSQKYFIKIIYVLCCKYCCWSHYCNLISTLHSLICCNHCNYSLTRTNVSL